MAGAQAHARPPRPVLSELTQRIFARCITGLTRARPGRGAAGGAVPLVRSELGGQSDVGAGRRRVVAGRFGAQSHGRSSISPRRRTRARSACCWSCRCSAFLPGFFSIPPIDRDEARFAQATKQMVETGDYYRHPLPGRGPLQEAGRHLLAAGRHGARRRGRSACRARARASGSIAFPRWSARSARCLRPIGRRLPSCRGARPCWPALMMASSMLLALERLLAKTDAMLLFTIVAAMGALARVYLPDQRDKLDGAGRWMVAAVFWTAMAAGVLLKGPVNVMIVGLTVITLVIVDRSARWLLALKPLLGFALVCAARAAVVRGDLPARGRRVFRLCGWPGSPQQGCVRPGIPRRAARVLLPAVLVHVLAGLGAGRALDARASTRRAASPRSKFLLAWLVPSWIVFELVVTKLPHYVLPLYPAIAILIAGVIDTRSAVARALADARRRLVVRASAAGGHRRDHRPSSSSAASSGCWSGR